MGANGQLCSRCQAVDKLMNFPKKTEAKQATPEAIGQSGARKPRLPLAAKVVYTGFVAILVPIYFRDYGPTNFLYFCDVALLLTLVGMWLENSLLISMCSVGILLPQLLWLIDFGGNFVGIHTTGMTNYMFDASIPLFTRGLSLFHGWLPLLLVWLLARVGYDQRALPAWTWCSAAACRPDA